MATNCAVRTCRTTLSNSSPLPPAPTMPTRTRTLAPSTRGGGYAAKAAAPIAACFRNSRLVFVIFHSPQKNVEEMVKNVFAVQLQIEDTASWRGHSPRWQLQALRARDARLSPIQRSSSLRSLRLRALQPGA